MTETILEPVDYADVGTAHHGRLRPLNFLVFLNGEPVERCMAACVSEGYVIRAAEDVHGLIFAIGDQVATEKLYGEVELYQVVKR